MRNRQEIRASSFVWEKEPRTDTPRTQPLPKVIDLDRRRMPTDLFFGVVSVSQLRGKPPAHNCISKRCHECVVTFGPILRTVTVDVLLHFCWIDPEDQERRLNHRQFVAKSPVIERVH